MYSPDSPAVISNFALGSICPMPTKPDELIKKGSDPLHLKANASVLWS